jgi:hypothetical protein
MGRSGYHPYLLPASLLFLYPAAKCSSKASFCVDATLIKLRRLFFPVPEMDFSALCCTCSPCCRSFSLCAYSVSVLNSTILADEKSASFPLFPKSCRRSASDKFSSDAMPVRSCDTATSGPADVCCEWYAGCGSKASSGTGACSSSSAPYSIGVYASFDAALAGAEFSCDTPKSDTLGFLGAGAEAAAGCEDEEEAEKVALGFADATTAEEGTTGFFFFVIPFPTDIGTNRAAAAGRSGAELSSTCAASAGTDTICFCSLLGVGRFSRALKSSLFIGSFLTGLPCSSTSPKSTRGSRLNAGSAPVLRFTPAARPLPSALFPGVALAAVAVGAGFFGAGSIALKPPNAVAPPRRGFFAGGASASTWSLSVRDSDAPGRLTVMRPGLERSTTLWNEGFGACRGAGWGAGGASPSDSESE